MPAHLIDEHWHPDHGHFVPHRLQDSVHAAVRQEEDDVGVRHDVLSSRGKRFHIDS